MQNIIIAVAIAVGAMVLVLASTWVGIPADTAVKGAAGLPALAIPIYNFLETQSAKRTLAHANSIVSFEEFVIHPLSAFILAVIMIVGIVNFAAAVSAFFVSAAMSQHRDLAQSQPILIFNIIANASLPLNVIGISYIGRWIGYRSRPIRGLGVALAAVVFGILAIPLVNVVMTPLVRRFFPSELLTDEIARKLTGADTSLFEFLYNNILGNKFMIAVELLYIIVISLGVWRGQRTRFARYLAFVLKVLPPETRQIIVEIARDEGVRASIAGRRGAPEAVRA